MLKDKQILEQFLEKESLKIVFDRNKCAELYDYANITYGLPQSMMADMLTQRVSLSECSEFQLFCMYDAINHIQRIESLKLNTFFTEQEITTYSKSKYQDEEIQFPIIINNVVEVSHDQWIGKMDISFLMDLRKAQLINYNVNAQRTMQRIVKGNDEFYRIALNKGAVLSIRAAYEKENFIPNTITLNIPAETNHDFTYDSENHKLIINSLEHFDVSDGYHRYIAISQIYDLNPGFEYPMELRIVNFSEDKAKQFIFQEDQKTKMRKLDSDALNMTKAANIVASRLNENHKCNLQGLISRNEGIVQFSELAALIHYFYFKNMQNGVQNGNGKEKTKIIEVTKDLIDNFNMLTEYDPKFLEQPYSFKQLSIIMFIFNYYEKKSKDNMCMTIDKVLKLAETIDNKKFYAKIPKKSLMNDIHSLVGEVLNNV